MDEILDFSNLKVKIDHFTEHWMENSYLTYM